MQFKAPAGRGGHARRPMASLTLRAFLTRLIWLCMLPLIALAIGLAVDFVRSSQATSQRAADRLARNVAAAIDHELEVRMGGLQMLAASALADDAAAWPLLYREAQGYRASFGSHVLFADLEGRIRFHTARPYGAALPALPRPEGRSAVAMAGERGRPAAGDLLDGSFAGAFPDPFTAEPMVALAAPGRRNGRTTFTVLSVLPARRFAERLQNFTVPAGWALELRDSRGQAIARAGATDAGAGTAADTGAFDRVELPLAAAPWSLALLVPRADSVAPLVSASLAMVLTVLGATLAGAFGGRWASRRLARSVQALTNAGTPGAADAGSAAGAGGIVEIDAAGEQLRQSQASLRLREAQMRAIFESASEAILTADEAQHIVMANQAAARMFGTDAAALVGRPLEELVPARRRPGQRPATAAFGEAGRSARAAGSGVGGVHSRSGTGDGDPVLQALHADGTAFPVEMAISHVVVDGRHLYTAILRDQGERLAAERALQQMNARLQGLLAAHDRVQEDERRRIARELHDDLQQTLAAMLMEADLAGTAIGADAASAHEALARLHTLATGAIHSTRRIVNDLRPQMLEELGLVAALAQLARRFGEQTGLECTMEPDHFTSEIGPHGTAVDLCLFRVAQEALNNVAKHAGARHVAIQLAITPEGGRTLTVADDGRGIAPEDHGRGGSFGLLGMTERVHAIGGTLLITGRAGEGTIVTVDVAPMPAPHSSIASIASITPAGPPMPAPAPAPPAAPAPAPAPPPPLSSPASAHPAATTGS